MKKHNFNILPEMNQDDYNRLKDDIQINGYDKNYPIYKYEEAILDGWNRQRVCDELNIIPPYVDFDGNDFEAIEFVMRSNNRRNLTSIQWACIAIEADDIVVTIKEQVEKDRRLKQAESLTESHKNGSFGISDKKLSETVNEEEHITATKVAKLFKTNRTYISEVSKLKKENPIVFELVKKGEKTLSELKKEEKSQKLEDKKAEYILQSSADILIKPDVFLMDYKDFLRTFEDDSADLTITDPPYMTDVPDIAKFTKSWLPLAIKKTKKTGRMLIFSGAYPEEIQAFLTVLMQQKKFIVAPPLIWSYKNTLGVTPKMYHNLNYQLIWELYSKDSPELDTSITNDMFCVMEMNAPDGRQGNRLHTWQKPEELALRLIRQTTKEGDLVVDPFTCTGTFLLAANRLNRVGIGCDNNKENLDIAIKMGCQLKTKINDNENN
jgi:DNA modification methylase